MIGILVVAHGDFAKGLVSALELIFGESESVDFLGIYHETSIDSFKEDVAKKMEQLDQGEGVLVFSDILNASPYNVVASNYKLFKDKLVYRSVTGTNLPMLIEAVCSRETMKLDELSKYIQNIGKEGIKELFETIERRI